MLALCVGQGGHLTTQHLSSQPHCVAGHLTGSLLSGYTSPHPTVQTTSICCCLQKTPIVLPDICAGPHSAMAPEAPKKLLWPRCLLLPRILAQAIDVITNQQHRPMRPLQGHHETDSPRGRCVWGRRCYGPVIVTSAVRLQTTDTTCGLECPPSRRSVSAAAWGQHGCRWRWVAAGRGFLHLPSAGFQSDGPSLPGHSSCPCGGCHWGTHRWQLH